MRAFKFLKENSYDIVKVFINQIGITIFSLVLYFSISSFKSSNTDLYNKLMVAISAFALIFFFALLYTAAWDLGANDKIRIESGKVNKRIYKGALITFCANIINFLFAGITLLTVACSFDGAMKAISGVCYTLYAFLNAMYNGVVRNGIMLITSSENPSPLYVAIAYFVAPLLPILASHIGYVFGMKNIKIFRTSPKKDQRK